MDEEEGHPSTEVAVQMRRLMSRSGGRTMRYGGRLAAVAAAALTSALLAALPTAPASAATPSITAVEAGQVEGLLDQVAVGTLDTEQLVKSLEGLLALEGIEAGTLEEALRKTIEQLEGEGANLGQLLESPASVTELEEALEQTLEEELGLPIGGLLETLLGGDPTQALTETLGSVSSSELLGSVLQTSGEPGKEITEALGSIPSAEVERVLGSVPTGEFSNGTVEELASQAGVTPTQLAEELGETSAQLPPSAMALTGTLANASKLGIVKSTAGVGMALLSGAEGLEGGGKKGAGGTGKEGSGGSGGSGAGGGGGSTTVIVQVPGSTASTQPSATGHTTHTTRGIRIVSHHVHGRTLTVVVSTPSPGTISLSASGVRTLRRHAARSGSLTLRTTLSRAALARHGHKRLRLSVRVAFAPSSGAPSSATAHAVFR
jgi:hypothetical protein